MPVWLPDSLTSVEIELDARALSLPLCGEMVCDVNSMDTARPPESSAQRGLVGGPCHRQHRGGLQAVPLCWTRRSLNHLKPFTVIGTCFALKRAVVLVHPLIGGQLRGRSPSTGPPL